ncbi:hypothetical protein [Actinomadura gamaensis]|uniref:Secreted protein n=1 Tax=Actinomadura gamaensis TaxID=1763541 RepID=A0ABV9U9H6_9ACTN
MRRIAAVAITSGALAAGLLASAGAASADQSPLVPSVKLPAATSGVGAAATHDWATKDGWSTLKASGTYSRTSKKVTAKVWLTDYKKNGWSPAVQFRTFTGKTPYDSRVIGVLNRNTGRPADLKFTFYAGTWYSTHTTHLYVREIGISVSNPRKAAFGPWKKLY